MMAKRRGAPYKDLDKDEYNTFDDEVISGKHDEYLYYP